MQELRRGDQGGVVVLRQPVEPPAKVPGLAGAIFGDDDSGLPSVCIGCDDTLCPIAMQVQPDLQESTPLLRSKQFLWHKWTLNTQSYSCNKKANKALVPSLRVSTTCIFHGRKYVAPRVNFVVSKVIMQSFQKENQDFTEEWVTHPIQGLAVCLRKDIGEPSFNIRCLNGCRPITATARQIVMGFSSACHHNAQSRRQGLMPHKISFHASKLAPILFIKQPILCNFNAHADVVKAVLTNT